MGLLATTSRHFLLLARLSNGQNAEEEFGKISLRVDWRKITSNTPNPLNKRSEGLSKGPIHSGHFWGAPASSRGWGTVKVASCGLA